MSSPCYPKNFLQCLLEFSNFVESSKSSDISREELLKSVETRLSLLVAKAVAAPTGASFSIFNRGEDQGFEGQRLEQGFEAQA